MLLYSHSMAYHTGILALMLLAMLLTTAGSSELVLEEGYTVETVFDGNKLGVHPYAILPLGEDIVMLDSLNSTLLRITLPVSQGSEIKSFAVSTRGEEGFADGDCKDAEFKHPKSFTVDAKGNIYVADRNNFAIRKISKTGVSTIAGGMSKKTGHADGSSQYALFSSDYDLTFIPSRCALLVSDRGNRMIRQINLPSDNCVQNSSLGTHWVPVISSLFFFLLGILIMFFAQPYIVAYEVSGFQGGRKTWWCFPINTGKQMLMSFFAIQSAIAKTWLYEVLSSFAKSNMVVVSLMFGAFFRGKKNMKSKPRQRFETLESLLNADIAPDKLQKESKLFSNPLEDLIKFDNSTEASIFGNLDLLEQKKALGSSIQNSKYSSFMPEKIEELIQTNLVAFGSEALFTDTSKCLSEQKSKNELWSVGKQLKKE